MAIKTQSKDISVHVDPLSFSAGIQIMSGSPVQTYSQADAEYLPDRSAVPCLLMPHFESYDPEGKMNGEQKIASVEWYEGAPKADGSNRITAETTGYVIGDTDCPAYSLKVNKNFNADTPTSIYCIFYVVDTRTNKSMTIERSVEFYTNMVFGTQTSLKLMNQPQTWIVDPLKVVNDEQGRWIQVITAQLFFGEEKVADENAAYKWQIWDAGAKTWRDFTDEELAVFVSGLDAQGHWGNTLFVDARFCREATFRCSAMQYEDTYPEAFTSDLLRVTTTMMVKLPESLSINIRQLAGAKVAADMSTEVAFSCFINANSRPIDEDRYSLFQVNWYAKSGKSGVSDKLIGRSRSIRFKPAILNFDKNYAISIYAVVKCYCVTAVVVEDTKWVVDTNGEVVVDNIYE